MREQSFVFTPEGIKRFADELENLKVEVSRRGSRADLSFLTNRINEMEKVKQQAVVSSHAASGDHIRIGSAVTLRDLEFDEVLEYSIVNRFEADPLKSKLSEESPVGKALKSRKPGDRITVEDPEGFLVYEILAVRNA